MTENEANIYSIAYRDCKEVANSIDVNKEHGKASTILFYMDEILEALKITSKLQAIGTVEEFRELKEKSTPKKAIQISKALDGTKYVGLIGKCPCCNSLVAEDNFVCEDCFQVLDWSEPYKRLESE